jgi:hypothetical protein
MDKRVSKRNMHGVVHKVVKLPHWGPDGEGGKGGEGDERARVFVLAVSER